MNKDAPQPKTDTPQPKADAPLANRLRNFLGKSEAKAKTDTKNQAASADTHPPESEIQKTPSATEAAPAAPASTANFVGKAKSSQMAVSTQEKTSDIAVEDERSLALSGSAITFTGTVLTAPEGALKVPDESRSLCALFDTGLWLVSASHRRSPLVTSVALMAKRQGLKVDEPRYVTPNIITQAYLYADRSAGAAQFDENAVRRKIVHILEKAVEAGANDIHIEAVNNRTRIEFRVDGALRVWETWTLREGEQILSSIYSHSIGQSGSTANWQEPQAAMLTADAKGREIITLPKGVISVRCQWVPLSNEGRYLDMRLQYDSAHLFGENFVMADVDSLGFSQEQLKVIQSMRSIPGGIRVFSGPVNQGKTTTLRVCLNRRMAETNMQVNCLMIEDPPEGGVIGARQIGVSASIKDEQREKTFVEIMRCALRLDPDIVMLGEVRDLQTAKFAFRLGLTGRQVYTTTHVYSALAIPKRLRDIGIEPYIIYDQHLLRGLVCQRLLRCVCTSCRVPLAQAVQEMGPLYKDLARRVRGGLALMDTRRNRANVGKPVMDHLVEPDLRNVYVANPNGCPNCYKGRQGRTICAEVIETDGHLMTLLQDNRMEDAENYWLSPTGLNGITMLWHGLEKVRRGEVSPDDAEFELGPFARERELVDIENHLGSYA